MTVRTILATGSLCCLLSPFCHAQQEAIIPLPKEKFLDHRIGVQANELIRQVFNFNNSTNNTLNNPYLLTYSITHAKTGLGLRLGVGAEFNSFKADDGITKSENDINKVNARAGIEKVFKLSGKWSAGAGADVVYYNNTSYTKTSVRTIDSSKTDLATSESTLGYGAMAWLRYHITPRIHIGTETSFYYRKGDVSQTLTISRRDFTGGSTTPKIVTTTDKLDNTVKEGIFRVPMVFYLVVMF